MNTLVIRLATCNQVLAEAKAELAEWQKFSNKNRRVRENKEALILLIIRLKQIQALLQNAIEDKRADLQAREFEAMNRYERGLR